MMEEDRNHKLVDPKKRSYLTNCLYVVGFLDLFGVSIIIPLLSRHATSLGASPSLVGLIGSVYGGLQFISGPIVGKLSDIIGRRRILLWCLIFSAVGYAVRGIATNLIILVISRIISGIFKHSSSTAKAYLAEITPKDERPKVFGRFNAISSVGFIIGPVCGGYLADDISGICRVAFITTSLFLLNAAMVYFFLDDHQPVELKHSPSVDAFTSDQFSIKYSEFASSFRKILAVGGDIFAVRFVMGFSLLIYHSNFSLFLEKKFDSSPKMTGFIISFSALMGVLASLLVGRVASMYSRLPNLLFHACILQTVTLMAMTFAPSVWLFLTGISLISISNSVLRVCITDMAILRCKGEDTGALLGLTQSVMSVARMVSPFIGGVALEISYSGPGIVASCCGIMGSLLVPLFVLQNEDIPKKDDDDKKTR